MTATVGLSCWKRTWQEATLFQDSFLHTQALNDQKWAASLGITFQKFLGLPSRGPVHLPNPTTISRLCVAIDIITTSKVQLEGK